PRRRGRSRPSPAATPASRRTCSGRSCGDARANWRAVASTVRLRWAHAAPPEHPAPSTAALTFPRRAAAPPCEGLFHVLNELSDQTRRKSEDDEPGAGHERRRASG